MVSCIHTVYYYSAICFHLSRDQLLHFSCSSNLTTVGFQRICKSFTDKYHLPTMQFSRTAVIAPYIKHDLHYLPFVVIIGKESFPAVWRLRALSSHDQFLSTALPFSLHGFDRIFLVCVCTKHNISILGYHIKYL